MGQMATNNKVLERTVFHAGQILIHAGFPHPCAYIVQTGEILAYILHNGKKLEVDRYGPGMLIAESCLMSEDPLTVNYEAITDSTLVSITHQDFQKNLLKADMAVKNVIRHMASKLKRLTAEAITRAEKESHVDEEAFQIVQHLVRNLSLEKKRDYEDAMLPLFNELVLVLRDVQERHRHEEQRQALTRKQAEILGLSLPEAGEELEENPANADIPPPSDIPDHDSFEEAMVS